MSSVQQFVWTVRYNTGSSFTFQVFWTTVTVTGSTNAWKIAHYKQSEIKNAKTFKMAPKNVPPVDCPSLLPYFQIGLFASFQMWTSASVSPGCVGAGHATIPRDHTAASVRRGTSWRLTSRLAKTLMSAPVPTVSAATVSVKIWWAPTNVSATKATSRRASSHTAKVCRFFANTSLFILFLRVDETTRYVCRSGIEFF